MVLALPHLSGGTVMTTQPVMSATYTLVFDPGITTGAALFLGAELLSVGAITDEKTIDTLIFRLPPASVVVCETFAGSRLMTSGQRTIELVGIIMFLTRKYLHSEAYLLRPQVKRGFRRSAMALLKANKPKNVSYLEHHYDAVALGLRYFYETHPQYAVSAYKVSDLLAIEEFSPCHDTAETKPLTAIRK